MIPIICYLVYNIFFCFAIAKWTNLKTHALQDYYHYIKRMHHYVYKFTVSNMYWYSWSLIRAFQDTSVALEGQIYSRKLKYLIWDVISSNYVISPATSISCTAYIYTYTVQFSRCVTFPRIAWMRIISMILIWIDDWSLYKYFIFVKRIWDFISPRRLRRGQQYFLGEMKSHIPFT